jgi:hypothetical protein
MCEGLDDEAFKVKQGSCGLPHTYFLAFTFFLVAFFLVVVFFLATGFFLAVFVAVFLFTRGIIVSLKVNSQMNDNRFFSITEILFYPNLG